MAVLEHGEFPFIAGESDRSRTPATFDTVNPADETLLAQVVQCDAQHVDDAVSAAAQAQHGWYAKSPSDRGAAMWRWSLLIEQHADEVALLDTQNTGQPFEAARQSVAGAVRSLQYWAGMCDKIGGRELPLVPGHLSYTRREPVGVVGVIIPWNAPVAGFAGRAGAAIACGNGAVVKPSEYSPASALMLARLAVEAGLPGGLLNVLTGDGGVGRRLTGHPGINSITFTGSVPTGRAINEAAAATFKKVTLELGGKSPNIVFADADLDAAVRGAAFSVFHNSGQVCCGGTRILVQRSIAETFTSRLAGLTAKIRVGDPMDSTVHLGPLASKSQFARVAGYIDVGRAEGATVLTGGGRPEHIAGERGYYVAPTIFTHVSSDMRIAQEEIFGPAVAILPFDDEEDALRIASDVEFGLAAFIWTTDGARMLRLADALEVGIVWGNTTLITHPGLPFGGFRNSGMGNAFGVEAIDGMTRTKRMSLRFDATGAYPRWPDLVEDSAI
jgi:acyl-CoA reductase-like NAD-dependent aldehyde dehydrogenase